MANRPQSKRQRDAPTLVPGMKNPRSQVVVAATGAASASMAGQKIYRLKCCNLIGGRECGHEYGANGTDVHLRKCPQCQGGKPGEPLREAPPMFDFGD